MKTFPKKIRIWKPKCILKYHRRYHCEVTVSVKLGPWDHHLVRTLNFPNSYHFLPPDTHTYVRVLGGEKFQLFFGKFCVHTKWMNSCSLAQYSEEI